MAHKNKTNVSPYTTRRQVRGPGQAPRAVPPGAAGARSSARRGQHRKPGVIHSPAEATDRLLDLFRHHDFADIPIPVVQKLARFYELLMLNQEKQNFTRLLSLRDVGIKHFMDCLILPRLTSLQFPLLDLGTGPGFPGIPLKLLFPQDRIILAEGVQRRVEFLKLVREDLGLEELPIIGRNINPFFAYPVRGVITRAVEDIRNTLLNVGTSLQTGGCVYFMKGPGVDPEIPLAAKECGEFFQLQKDIPYTLPNTTNHRRLLIYKKIKATPLVDFDEEPWPDE